MRKIDEVVLEKVIRRRPTNAYKGNFGHIMIIGGSRQYGGAAIMSASGAVYAGSGLVTCVTDSLNFTALHSRLPEAMVVDRYDFELINSLLPKMDVIVIGPGLGIDNDGETLLLNIYNKIQLDQILIIDGSALTLTADKALKLPKANIILTPHQMEWKRLSGLELADQTPENNMKALNILGKANITLVLKGPRTQVYFGDHEEWWENTVGNPGMATGGMGDVLTGIIAAFCGQFAKYNYQEAILGAVYCHSAIGDELTGNHYVVLPTAIIKELPHFMVKYSQEFKD